MATGKRRLKDGPLRSYSWSLSPALITTVAGDDLLGAAGDQQEVCHLNGTRSVVQTDYPVLLMLASSAGIRRWTFRMGHHSSQRLPNRRCRNQVASWLCRNPHGTLRFSDRQHNDPPRRLLKFGARYEQRGEKMTVKLNSKRIT